MRTSRSQNWKGLGLLLWAASLLGCAQSEAPTQLVVTIAGDEEVLRQLRRIDAKLYATDAPEGATPVAQHTFRLPMTGPMSFGITRGQAERVLVVVEGYDSDDSRVRPFIERKQRVAFADAESLEVDVFLARECFRLSKPCLTLGTTCRADARACAAVPEAATAPVVPGAERAATAPARPPVAEACAKSTCARDYPCVPTVGAGYTCLGQFADWPMPDPTPGAANAPKYEVDDALVRDLVTGLTWQRQLPASYPGCSGIRESNPVPGSLCTIDEAKIYCHELTLGGLAWRVPSKIELESLLDPTSVSFAISRDLFPGCDTDYWSSSPEFTTDEAQRSYWHVDGKEGRTTWGDGNRPACVRCVTGHPSAPGTPAERYRRESDGSVTDTRTRLRWDVAISAPLSSIEAATMYCSSLGGGRRLPSLKELLTLVDPMRESPASDPIFIGTPAANFWSAQGNAAGERSVKLVSFTSGFSIAADARVSTFINSANPRTRCVR